MTEADAESLALQFRGFLNTPPVWQKEFAPFPQFRIQAVKTPENLKLDIPASLPLGRRVEHFFAHYIESYTEQEILTANAQITSEKITVGELDFLLKDPVSNKVTHVELVYKFYIYDPSFASEEARWIGPNRRDSLSRKQKHLTEHQFPLLYRQETQPLLDQFNLKPEEIQQQVCFRANLFVPKKLLKNSFPVINSACIRGYWIKMEDFSGESYESALFYTPKKADWPKDPAENREWKNFSEIMEQLQALLQRKKSPLVWMKKASREVESFFIVCW